MDDLVAAFLPRFKSLATTRLERCLAIAQQPDGDGIATIARELHATAGEAGLLGLSDLVALARTGEEHAKRLRTTPGDEAAKALVAALTELKRAIELVTPANQPDGGSA